MKKLLYGLLILAAIYLVLCVTGPKDMNTTVTVSMKGTPAQVMEEVGDFQKMHAWSPWARKDTAMKSTVTGAPYEVGHRLEWSGNSKVGSGRQWISEIKKDEYMRTLLNFGDYPDTVSSVIKAVGNGDSTAVSWSMENTHFPFLARGMMMIMGMSKGMKPDFTEGLGYLKAIVEAKPSDMGVSYEVTDMPDQWYVGKMHPGVNYGTADSATMHNMYDVALKEINAYLASMKVAPAGNMLGISHNYNQETNTTDLEIAIIVADSVPASGNLRCMKIPAGHSAKYVHVGDYRSSGAAWGAFMASLMKDHQPRWSAYEEYVVSPMTEKDPNKYVTNLIVPVQ